MIGNRLKVLLKNAVFLDLTVFVLVFLAELVNKLVFSQAQANDLMPILIVSVLTVPFVYFFAYKTAEECIKKKYVPLQKNIGSGLGFGMVAFATLISAIIGYLLDGHINFSMGLLGIIFGWIGGGQAEKKFIKK